LAMGPVKTSMWQDIEAGRPTEVDYINGFVARRSAEIGLDAPANHMLTALLHAMDSNLMAHD
ncbi:MAG: 2-dehydropantoate 2-reductase, partial [Deltaproteobacteria bacterium]